MWLLPLGAALACDPDAAIITAYGALLAGDRAGAEAGLATAEGELACTPAFVDPQTLARFWLVEGALSTLAGDPDAEVSFAAARRVAPDLWLGDLPESARLAWAAAAPETGTGAISLDVVPGTRAVAVDGRPFTGDRVPAGLHAVQVADPDGSVRFAAMVYVGAGTVADVATGLAPPDAPAPVPTLVAEVLSAPRPRLGLQILTGASFSYGRPLISDALSEPSAKLVLPLEVAGEVVFGQGWVRAELGTGWLVGGPYLSSTASGELHRTPFRFDAALAGGVQRGAVRLGLATGLQWPGRLSERVLVGLDLAGPLLVELRVGVNPATARPLEPAIEALAGVAFH